MDRDNQVIFHPINDDAENLLQNKVDIAQNKLAITQEGASIAQNKAAIAENLKTITENQEAAVENKEIVTDDKKKIIEHIGIHYRKYLFGLGVFGGLMISLIGRVVFNSSATSNPLFAGYEMTPELEAIAIFNQMDAIAHEKDNFFHQSGKIYTISGDTLFRKYDTMFHVLDNAYHRAVSPKEKILRAQRLTRFIKIQNGLFAATAYISPEKDKLFESLDQEFTTALEKITADKDASLTSTGTTETTGAITTRIIIK